MSSFAARHLGSGSAEMLRAVGFESLDALANAAVPAAIRFNRPLNLPAPLTETEALAALQSLMAKNQLRRSYIGMGYYDCVTPPVIQRNILENPGW
jgi:glycine dehydrogenase